MCCLLNGVNFSYKRSYEATYEQKANDIQYYWSFSLKNNNNFKIIYPL